MKKVYACGRLLAVIALAGLLGACAAQRGGDIPNMGTSSVEQPRTTAAAIANADVELDVLKTTLPGDPGYLPRDHSWVQYTVQITDRGKKPIKISQVAVLGANGVYRQSANSSLQVYGTGSAQQEMGTDLAVGMAAMIFDVFVSPVPFPVATAVTGTAQAMDVAGSIDDQRAYVAAVEQRMLWAATLPPGKMTSGEVFVRAAPGDKFETLTLEYVVADTVGTKVLSVPLTPSTVQ